MLRGCALLTCCLATVALAGDPPLTPDEFKKVFTATQSSTERRAAVRRLAPVGPHAEESLALLTDFVLEEQEWYMREAAIAALAAHADALAPRLETIVAPRAHPLLIEGVLLALGATRDQRHVPLLVDRLGTAKNWKVKRAAARALGLLEDPRAIEPLLRAWEEEPTHLVELQLREALSRILGCPVSGAAAEWRRWLREHGPDDVDHRPAPPAEVREVEHVVDGVRFRVRLRGRGEFGVFVLPELGLTARALEPAYEPLDTQWRMATVSMPLRDDLPLSREEPGPHAYPVARVAGGLAGLADVLGRQEAAFAAPYGVVASGLSGWVAMAHAAAHPQRVRRMTLVGVHSSRQALLEGVQRMAMLGQAQRHLERELLAPAVLPGWKPEKDWPIRDDEAAAARIRWTYRVADYRDLQLSWWLGAMVERHGRFRFAEERLTDGLAVPEFALSALPSVATPTLVMLGKNSVFTSKEDGDAIAAHYGSAGRLVEFPNCDSMPMIEQNEKFCEILQKFTAIKPPAPPPADEPR